VSCDWEGNVYCTGISKDADDDGHFMAVKLNGSTGLTVWPNSGSHSSPDYDFHNGAIKLSDDSSDGLDGMAVPICAMSMKNEPGDEPTFAITGPTNPSGGGGKWRTVVFEYDSTNGVRVKSGWPVDDFGDHAADISRAVAIGTDNTVYVTGGVHVDGDAEQFTTVRYKAGGNNVSPVRYWTDDDWITAANKGSHGKAIALDYDGNAYVTGDLIGGTAPEIGTAKLKKEASSPHQEAWRDYYHPCDGSASPNSISLSFEIEDDAIKTYTYVTGLRTTEGFIGSKDVLTIRYLTTGVRDWFVNSSTLNQAGLHVEAIGYGNAYVAGSNDLDYLINGYRRSGTARFTASYDNDDENDEARSCVVGAAGLAYYTCVSPESGQDDLLTLSHTESHDTLAPRSADVTRGIGTGDETGVAGSDDSYLQMDTETGDGKVIAEFGGVVTTSSPTELSVTIEGHVSTSGIRERVEVYDQIIGDYVWVADQPATTSDAKTVIPLKDDPKQYIDGSGKVNVRVTYYGSSAFSAYIDLMRWDILGS